MHIAFSIQDKLFLNNINTQKNIKFYAFDAYLQFGDISCDCVSDNRKKSLFDMFGNTKYWCNNWKNFENSFIETKACMDHIKQAQKNGEEIYIWGDHSPGTTCGVYYLISLFARLPNDIYYLDFSPYQFVAENKLKLCTSWEDLKIEKNESLSFYLENRCRKIEKPIQCIIQKKWNELTLMNAPHRIIVNGELYGCDYTFITGLIIEGINKGYTVVAELIAYIISNYVYIHQIWIESAIHNMSNKKIIRLESNVKDYYLKQIYLL